MSRWWVTIGLALIAALALVIANRVTDYVDLIVLSSRHHHEALAKRLARDTSEIDAAGSDNLTPLQMAVKQDCASCATLLLAAGASPHAPGYTSPRQLPMHLAAMRGHTEMVHLLASYGASLNATDALGLTPMDYAIRHRHEGLVGHLVKRGASLTTRDKYGWTPLHWAAFSNLNQAVPMLVEAGADMFCETRIHFELEKFEKQRLDRQIGTLRLKCWRDSQGTGSPEIMDVPLFNWENAPEQRLPALRAEHDFRHQMMTPLDLAHLLKRDAIVAYLEQQMQKRQPKTPEP